MDEPQKHAKWNKLTQKYKYIWFQWYEVPRVVKLIKKVVLWLPVAGGEKEIGNYCLMGTDFQYEMK